MLPDAAPIILAASVGDWIERVGPLVLLAVGLAVLVLRGRDRRRGPDEDDE